MDGVFKGDCMQPHEKIGVVDTQWVVHQGVPSLGNQVNKKEALKVFLKCSLYGLTLNPIFFGQ